MSVTLAPRARIAVKAAWPGVSRKVIFWPFGLDLIGADVLGDAAGFARHDVGLADRVEQRGLAVVDVAHDGDDRRARAISAAGPGRRGGRSLGGGRSCARAAWAPRRATRSFILLIGGLRFQLRSAPTRVFLCTAARFRLGLDARLFLGLTAGGVVTLLAAALLVVLPALGFRHGALAVFHLTSGGAFKRLAAGFHLAGRQFVQHKHAAIVGRLRPLRLGRAGRRGSGLRLLRRGDRSARLERLDDSRRLRLFAGLHEFALGLDDDLLGAAMRKILPHSRLRHARRLQRQGLLRLNVQRLVVASFRITHSISSAAPSALGSCRNRLLPDFFRGSAPVPVERNRAPQTPPLPASPARTRSMYHICAPQCQTQFGLGEKFISGDFRPP
jgi:hypothetical protein